MLQPYFFVKAALVKLLDSNHRQQAAAIEHLENSSWFSELLNLIAGDRKLLFRLSHLIWEHTSIRKPLLLKQVLDKVVHPKSYLKDLTGEVVKDYLRPAIRKASNDRTKIEAYEYLHLLDSIRPREYVKLLEFYLDDPENHQYELIYHLEHVLKTHGGHSKGMGAVLYQIWMARDQFDPSSVRKIKHHIPSPDTWETQLQEDATKYLRHELEQASKATERIKIYEGLEIFGKLRIDERISLTKQYLQNPRPYRKPLAYQASVLLDAFQNVIDCKGAYEKGLASVLIDYLPWASGETRHQYEALQAYLLIFLRLENPEAEALKNMEFFQPPVFHSSAETDDQQALVAGILQENPIDINGSNVDVWLIKESSNGPDEENLRALFERMQQFGLNALPPAKVNQLILCGHSIEPICRRVTSMIHLAKSTLDNDEVNRFTAGFAWLENTEVTQTPGKGEHMETAFETLEKSLNHLKEQTGLLHIHQIAQEDYEQQREAIEQGINTFLQTDESSTVIETAAAQKAPLILPVYCYDVETPQPLSFRVPAALIESKSYFEVHSLYNAMAFGGMELDLQRKINVIRQWRLEREEEKARIEFNLSRNRYLIVPREYSRYPQHFLDTLSPAERSKYGYTARYSISDDWRTGQRTRELSKSFVTWSDRLEQLKSSTEQDEAYIKFYQQKLREVERNRDSSQNRFDVELIDIMLRRWDLGFMFQKLKDLYEQWAEEVCPLFWSFLREQTGSAVLGTLSQMKNVWFDVVESEDGGFYTIHPRIVVEMGRLQLSRRDGLLFCENIREEKSVTMSEEQSPDAFLNPDYFKALLCNDYRQTLDQMVSDLRQLIRFEPRFDYDLDGRMQVIEEKQHFNRQFHRWNRSLQQEAFDEALAALDAMESEFGQVPEIYYYRAYTFAARDAHRVNRDLQQFQSARLWGNQQEEFRLPAQIILDYVIETRRMTENYGTMKEEVKHLIRHTDLLEEDQIIENMEEVRQLDPGFYDAVMEDRQTTSRTLTALQESHKLSFAEQIDWHFYQAVQLFKCITAINRHRHRADRLMVLKSAELKEQFEVILESLQKIEIPYFVDDGIHKWFHKDIVGKKDRNEMDMKIFLSFDLQAILDRLFGELLQNLKIVQTNNHDNGILYPFLTEIHLRTLQFRDAVRSLFPDRFPLAFHTDGIEFHPGFKDVILQEEDRLDLSYDENEEGVLFYLVHQDEEKVFAVFNGKMGDDNFNAVQKQLNREEQYGRPLSIILEELHLNIPAEQQKKLNQYLGDVQLNHFIRATLFGNYELVQGVDHLKKLGLREADL